MRIITIHLYDVSWLFIYTVYENFRFVLCTMAIHSYFHDHYLFILLCQLSVHPAIPPIHSSYKTNFSFIP